MIASATGEVYFQDGLSIVAHCPVLSLFRPSSAMRFRRLAGSVRKWHALGIHRSDHGLFEVEVVSGLEDRVQAVFLAHFDSSYRTAENAEVERGAYHEAVIAADLKGQREFSWGEVGCNLSDECKKEWLVVAYNQGPHVLRPQGKLIPQMVQHEPIWEQSQTR